MNLYSGNNLSAKFYRTTWEELKDLELFVKVGVVGMRVDTIEKTIADVDVIADDSMMSK